jgi:hypothetical protein
MYDNGAIVSSDPSPADGSLRGDLQTEPRLGWLMGGR